MDPLWWIAIGAVIVLVCVIAFLAYRRWKKRHVAAYHNVTDFSDTVEVYDSFEDSSDGEED